MKKNILYAILFGITIGGTSTSCSDYLNVEGELKNAQNIEKIFESRDYTEQWLAEAFYYLTRNNSDINTKDYCITNFSDDMVFGDRGTEYQQFKYAEYNENYKNESWSEAYAGIRQASILIHNVDRNLEMSADEIKDTKAQARFVRAYLYWKLLQKYGPIPLLPDEGLDYDIAYDDLSIPRNTYDECAEFISNEMILAAKDLPTERDNRNISRPTRGAALATRAKALLYAASPINNPRPADTERFTDLVDDRGRFLMAQEYNNEKWARAAAAALDVIELGKYEIYTKARRTSSSSEGYPLTIAPPEHPVYSLENYPDGWADIDPYDSYRSLFNGDLYPSNNPEMIFTLGLNDGGQGVKNMVYHQLPHEGGGYNCHSMTGKQCDAYEMNTGVPFERKESYGYVTMEEDNAGTYKPLKAGVSKEYANREPRFYASVAYNGCLWNFLNATKNEYRNKQVFYYRGESSGWANTEQWLLTGIGIMKYVSPRDLQNQGSASSSGGYVINKAPLCIRYADVLLWYAEALNEVQGDYEIMSWDNQKSHLISRDEDEMSFAISRVRLRAGLPNYGVDVYRDPDEFRRKLKHERQIEFFAENSRYFDLRRWKDAEKEESELVKGCNPKMSEKDKDLFHKQIVLSFIPTTFNRKMYFWPISHEELKRNKRLTQNPGWTYND